jgi:hypothetical protein
MFIVSLIYLAVAYFYDKPNKKVSQSFEQINFSGNKY